MKLYAITTSERASKGQGGNEYLHIDVITEDREAIASIDIRTFDNGRATMNWDNFLSNVHTTSTFKLKGKSQKGECKHFIVKDDYGKEYCQECGTYKNL